MTLEFKGTTQQIELVRTLAVLSHDDYARKWHLIRRNIHRGPFCDGVSYRLAHKLREEGYPARYRYHLSPNGGGTHIHVGLGNNWIADAQWQQFLERTDDPLTLQGRELFPHVIVAPLFTLPALFTKYGVDPENFPTWVDAADVELDD